MEDFGHLLKDDLHDLHTVLYDLKKSQKKQSSLKWNFWRGVFYGFGFFVGSAILVSLVAYVLRHIGADGDSLLGEFIQGVIQLFQEAR